MLSRSADSDLEGRRPSKLCLRSTLRNPSVLRRRRARGTLQGVEIVRQGIDKFSRTIFLQQFQSKKLADFSSGGADAGVTRI